MPLWAWGFKSPFAHAMAPDRKRFGAFFDGISPPESVSWVSLSVCSNRRILKGDGMSRESERAELHKTIWKIANDLRGAVDSWDFKAYVLGILFYRFISENLTS